MTPPGSEEEPPAPRQRRDWGSFAAVIASLVGLLALGVSAYTAHVQWLQTSAQVWPHLMRVSSNSETEHKLIVFNKGTGPALIRSVVVRLDGKPQRDWTSVLDAIDPRLKDANVSVSTSSINGITLSAGERYEYFLIEDAKNPLEMATRERVGPQPELGNFAQAWKIAKPAMERIETRICYCSVLKQCWTIGTGMKASDPQGVPVDHCERNEDDEFRN